ncbi:MAG: c-type cytochrome [Deltaproteobacteria bacterium]|nr:c-type cytochrome [Deltaproteobacteria bacterium]
MRARIATLALMLGLGLGVAQLARADLLVLDGRAPLTLPGPALYDRMCSPCHGAAGDGRGPAAPWLWPRPRDFTAAAFKWRSTPVGQPPTDADLAATIRFGAPGTSMPGFAAVLGDDEITQLVGVVRAFGPAGAPSKPMRPPPPAPTGDLAARGLALWTSLGCVACHGTGRGDGPAAAALGERAPYDLTAEPLRRPRPGEDDAAIDAALYASIATGLDGTPMPGSDRPAPELWALVAYVDTIRYRGPIAQNAQALPSRAIANDRAASFAAGYWPGAGAPEEAVLFGGAIDPMGPPPPSLAPAEASLSERQCARCHAKQAREWTGTIHSQAGSPGLIAQILRPGFDMAPKAIESCQRCHGPLAEQQPTRPIFDPALRAEGVTCAACHVRGWTRHGPPLLAPSLLQNPGYPLATLAIYERADFCLPCHQLPARLAVNGRPLLDTYREWLTGPYMKRGIQCQSCHMPNREHTWKGVHDPDTFRQGIKLEAIAARTPGGAVNARARVTNVGAGHFLPTTPTPAAWLRITLVDAAGRAIAGARAEKRLGRAIEFKDGGWHELEDTRIPPGGSRELAGAWADGRVAEAVAARISIEVHPDDYYEGFYQRALKGKLAPANRALYEAALTRAQGSYYVAETRDVPLTTPSSPSPRAAPGR